MSNLNNSPDSAISKMKAAYEEYKEQVLLKSVIKNTYLPQSQNSHKNRSTHKSLNDHDFSEEKKIKEIDNSIRELEDFIQHKIKFQGQKETPNKRDQSNMYVFSFSS